jgi:hypothetical protein
MKKLILVITIVLFVLSNVNAQDYKTGIGVRGGLYNGLTIKHFLGSRTAVEGLISTRWSGLEITGLYEINNDNAFDVDRLNWYFGLGGHVGFYNGDNTTWGSAATNYTVIGVDGILGLEYNLAEIPINISIDWKPAFNLIGYSKFWGDGGAISLRYIF